MMTLQEQFAAQVPAQEVIQRQLAAYNARDIEALLATYHEDAEQKDRLTVDLEAGRSGGLVFGDKCRFFRFTLHGSPSTL